VTSPVNSSMKRIAVLCEVLHPPLDEGVRILAAEIALALSRRCAVTLMGEIGAEVRGLPVQGVLTDRFFAGGRLAEALRTARPDAILYVPWTSLTARTFLRVALLRRRAPGVPIGVLALQPRPAGWLTRAAARWGTPDRCFAVGPEVESQIARLGAPSRRLEGGVDLDRFRPLGEESLADLRRSLSLPVSAYIVLHVGHLKPARGILSLRALQALDGVQTVLIASSSTEGDPATRRILQEAGVRVLDRHLPNVEEYYRASDCYLFPVTSSLDAIELPLSVLEAMACNLPIITSRFGGLPSLLEASQPGVAFFSAEEEIPRILIAFRKDRARPRLRERVAGLTWDAMAERILDGLSDAPVRRRPEAAEARG
jgi:glycosyltransferase involved in cell wall biosynthesis